MVFSKLTITNCKTGIKFGNVDRNQAEPQGVATVSVIDSSFVGTPKPIVIPDKTSGYVPNLVLDNVDVQGADKIVTTTLRGKPILTGTHVDLWATGRRYTAKDLNGTRATSDLKRAKIESLMHDDKYFSQPKPQYENEARSNFVSVLDYGVNGDGQFTPGNAEKFNNALQDAVKSNKILVIPAGSYIVDKTLEIPLNSRIAGILYPQLVAYGEYFSNPKQPKPVLEVGKKGDRGLIYLSDLIVTNRGPTAGAIFIQWNVHQDAQGSAAMWDCIVRVGGAVGTDITNSNCQKFGNQEAEKYEISKVRTGTNWHRCMAGSALLHVTPDSSIYMENSWFWVAGKWSCLARPLTN
jgi:hypothetical protein